MLYFLLIDMCVVQSECMNYSYKLCNQILYACVLKVFFSTASLVLRKVTWK